MGKGLRSTRGCNFYVQDCSTLLTVLRVRLGTFSLHFFISSGVHGSWGLKWSCLSATMLEEEGDGEEEFVILQCTKSMHSAELHH